MFQLTPTVRNLLIINVVIFAAGALLNIDFVHLFGLRYIFAETFEPYQIILHMFTHASTMHIFSNMLALVVFGPALEMYWGLKRFLVFYLICGFGASALYSAVEAYELYQFRELVTAYVNNPDYASFERLIAEHGKGVGRMLYQFIDQFGDRPNDPRLLEQSTSYAVQLYQLKENIPMVGASGAVFGILMAFGMMFPNVQLMLLFPPIPVRAKYLVLFYGLYEVYAVMQAAPSDNVAHFAHIGGMIFAFFMIQRWRKRGEI
jgi:membrane associated rhomboid family serine protease